MITRGANARTIRKNTCFYPHLTTTTRSSLGNYVAVERSRPSSVTIGCDIILYTVISVITITVSSTERCYSRSQTYTYSCVFGVVRARCACVQVRIRIWLRFFSFRVSDALALLPHWALSRSVCAAPPPSRSVRPVDVVRDECDQQEAKKRGLRTEFIIINSAPFFFLLCTVNDKIVCIKSEYNDYSLHGKSKLIAHSRICTTGR